jgi:hypothetical protein
VRHLRDVIVLTVGASLCLSQMLVQWQGGEPNIPMLTAGVSLLAGYPLVKLGDRRTDGADNR